MSDVFGQEAGIGGKGIGHQLFRSASGHMPGGIFIETVYKIGNSEFYQNIHDATSLVQYSPNTGNCQEKDNVIGLIQETKSGELV